MTMNMLRYCLLFLTTIGWTQLWGQIDLDSVRIIYDHTFIDRLRSADLDNDGDVDMVSASTGVSGELFLFEHIDGQGQFSAPRALGDSTWYGGLGQSSLFELGDMDNDGDVDMVQEKWAASTKPFWANDGSALFPNPMALSMCWMTTIMVTWLLLTLIMMAGLTFWFLTT